MKTEKVAKRSRNRKAKKVGRPAKKLAKGLSGQPAIDKKYRYMEVIVDNDMAVKKAIDKITSAAGTSQKDAIQETILKAAAKL